MKKALLIILAIGLFSCSKDEETNPVLNQDYYEVNKNDTFDVSLYASPGLYWRWVNTPTDVTVELIGTSFVLTKVPEGILGSGGNDIWKFKGKESGIYTLTFEYYGSGTSNSTLETKNITVKIN
ncbi:protease inhibitor I42 family protein [Flavobacterium undicola]|uniref:protease inhibitor I42 family protein n=1 Tax=Flavobacterium undicola TaxID=1932779 RepID=UPI001377BAC3|nr:protease inhibitor I42 family protein [Flavobacterium undicola]MBA0882219.1 protease inhibitor I42 family protein [Flavobacterium undicola]